MDIFGKCTFHYFSAVRLHLSSGDNKNLIDQGTIVAAKLCNLISLPDSEMDREPQHAGKAGALITI